MGQGPRHARRDRAGGPLPEGPALGRHVPQADGHREPAPDAALHRTRRGNTVTYERNTKELPPETVEIKPHPHGVELGRLIEDAQGDRSSPLVSGFLQEEFSRVGTKVAQGHHRQAGKGLTEKLATRRIARDEADRAAQGDPGDQDHVAAEHRLHRADRRGAAPQGPEEGDRGRLLRRQPRARRRCTAATPSRSRSRSPTASPAASAWSHEEGEIAGRIKKRQGRKLAAHRGPRPARTSRSSVVRFANRVPLLYQQSACA